MTDKPTTTKKDRSSLQFRGIECTNCGHGLDMSDKYCPNCSQVNSTKKLSLKDFFDAFFSNLLSYDSKLLKTLTALLWRPGKITRDYIDGKRVSYTNPFRFLLSLSIIYFLMLNFSSNFSSLDDQAGSAQTEGFLNRMTDLSFLDRPVGVNNIELDSVGATLDSLNISSTVSEVIRKHDSVLLSDPKKKLSTIASGRLFKRFPEKIGFFNTLLKYEKNYDYKIAFEKYGFPETAENRAAFNAARSFIRFLERPGSFISSLISKLPFLIFFFLPFFTLFIWLVYIRKKYTYTDHLIFSFHNQSLLFILLIISFLIDSLFGISTAWIFLIIFSGYLYKSMRRFYGEGRFKTIVKYSLLNTIFFILAIFSIVILFTGSIFTF